VMEYQRLETEMTLQQGLEEYYASRIDLKHGRGMSQAAIEFFRCHDTVHVVFGLNTELPSEAGIKMWSFFGTDVGLKRLYQGYRLGESKEIYTSLGFWQILDAGIRSLAIVPLVMLQCFRMNKRWSWSEFGDYLSTPLSSVREEFGITLVRISGQI
jgi:hypothetical protein